MRPITDFLIEFPRAMPPTLLVQPPGEAAASPGGAAEAEAIEQALSEARRGGMAEARALSESLCAERLAALGESHAADLAAARARWAAHEGAALAEALRAGLDRVQAMIGDCLAAVLFPVLDGALRARAGSELAAAVGQLLAGGDGATIEVRGPADLLGPIRAAFADNAAVALTETDEAEVSMSAGDALIASQVGAWSARLRAALETEA